LSQRQQNGAGEQEMTKLISQLMAITPSIIFQVSILVDANGNKHRIILLKTNEVVNKKLLLIRDGNFSEECIDPHNRTFVQR
jgi:hypothetical protein